MADVIIQAVIKLWQSVTAPDQAGRTRVMCSPHNNFPDGCFHLHYPQALKR